MIFYDGDEDRIMSEARLFVPATFVSFRRNKRTINPNQALLNIQGVNSNEEAKWYVGKKLLQ